MRIALIITELHPGGAEKCFVNLVSFLHRQGHSVAVWQLWPAPPVEKSLLTSQLDQLGIPWKSGGASRVWHFPGVIRWLRRELAGFQPDVVQAFLFHANLASVLASRGQAWGVFGGARVRQPQRLRQRLQSWASGGMQKLICVSQDVAQHCLQVERIPADKICVIPNGIVLNQPPIPAAKEAPLDQPWSSLGLPVAAPVLLFVGRLTEQKGVVQLLEQIADPLLTKLPQHHLVLMGEGDQTERLNAMHQLCRYRDRIHLVGWQPQAEVWMQHAQLLLLPARYEGMPNVVLEAMQVGRAVVSFDVEGVRELLGTGPLAEAQIVASQDTQAFAQATANLANQAELRQRCEIHNRHRVEQHFQLEPLLARYLQLYENWQQSVGRRHHPQSPS